MLLGQLRSWELWVPRCEDDHSGTVLSFSNLPPLASKKGSTNKATPKLLLARALLEGGAMMKSRIHKSDLGLPAIDPAMVSEPAPCTHHQRRTSAYQPKQARRCPTIRPSKHDLLSLSREPFRVLKKAVERIEGPKVLHCCHLGPLMPLLRLQDDVSLEPLGVPEVHTWHHGRADFMRDHMLTMLYFSLESADWHRSS